MSAMHHFYHEIGHARFHKIQRDQPEKVTKFEEQVIEEIGQAPSEDAESYRDAVDREARWVKDSLTAINDLHRCRR